jgi:FkbM family methyltransferase
MTIKTVLLNFLRQLFKFKPFELLLTKFTVGKEFGTFFTLLPPNHYQYAKKSYRQANREGVNYFLDISDTVDWYIYFGFKEASREKLFSLVKKSDVVIDIGANVGNVSLGFSKLVGETGKIYSFEPDPLNFKRFKKNVDLNHFKNIETLNFGLGNKKGSFSIVVHDELNRGMNRLVENAPSENTVLCEVLVLDDFISQNKVNKVDLIKIDVEGFEKKVLEGAYETLKFQRPILFIELDDNNLKDQGSSARDLIKYLEELKYRMVHSEKDISYTSDMGFSNCHFDIIAFPN